MVKTEHRCSSGLEASGRAGAQEDLELVLRSRERGGLIWSQGP